MNQACLSNHTFEFRDAVHQSSALILFSLRLSVGVIDFIDTGSALSICPVKLVRKKSHESLQCRAASIENKAVVYHTA
jgi:hypothetical protein